MQNDQVSPQNPITLWEETIHAGNVGFGAFANGQPMLTIMVPIGLHYCRMISIPIDPTTIRLALAQVYGGAKSEVEMPSSVPREWEQEN